MPQVINKDILQYHQVRGLINSFDFLDMIGEVPHPGQIEILNAFEKRMFPSEDAIRQGEMYGIDFEFEYAYQTLVAACGRRFGKSKFAAWLGAMELMIPHSQVLLVSGVEKNCEIIFNQVLKIVKNKLKLPLSIERSRDMCLEVAETGSRFIVGSVDTAESRLGNAISLLIVDEAKLFRKDIYEQILEPMLADYFPYGRSILISSPEEGWFETYYDYGQAGIKGAHDYRKYWSINLPTSCNPTINQGYLAQKKATLPPDVYAQEYEGSFRAKAGAVYPEFTREKHAKSSDCYPHLWNWIKYGNVVVNSIDPGYSHFFASVHFVYVNEIDTYIVFGEYNVNNTTTPVIAGDIKQYERDVMGRESDLRFCDYAAAQTIADLVEHDLMFSKCEKPLRETVQFVNSLCYQTSSVTGEPRLIVLSDLCPELTRQLSTVKWKEDQQAHITRESSTNKGVKPFAPDKDVKGHDWDLMDALRYGLYTYGKGNMDTVTVFELDPEEDSEEVKFLKEMANLGFHKV